MREESWMIDDELKLNRKIIEDLFVYAGNGDVPRFLDLHAADACIVDPVLGCLSGDELKSFLSKQFDVFRQFDVEHSVLDVGLCSSLVRLAVSARDDKTAGQQRLEIDANVVTRDGIVLRHELDFDITKWARTMLPGVSLYRGVLPWWRRKLAAQAYRLLINVERSAPL
jgi:hypothetical protein